MARPKKEKELRRNHNIMLPLTDTEYEIISANAKSTNLPLAEYARKQVTNKKVIADIYEMKYAVLKMAGDFQTTGTTENSDIPKGEFHGDTETHSE